MNKVLFKRKKGQSIATILGKISFNEQGFSEVDDEKLELLKKAYGEEVEEISDKDKSYDELNSLSLKQLKKVVEELFPDMDLDGRKGKKALIKIITETENVEEVSEELENEDNNANEDI